MNKLFDWFNNKSKSNDPEWHTVEKGILKGQSLYINTNMPAYKDMKIGSHDNFLFESILDLSNQPKVVFDVGAHIGYHSLAFAKIASPRGKVYAFEPNNTNFSRIKLNLKRNKELSNKIDINNHALYSYKGHINFKYSDNIDDQTSSGGYINEELKPLPDKVYKNSNFKNTFIPVDTIDNFSEHKNLKEISLIKIDVEGAEHNVLLGATKSLNKFKPVLYIEIHSVESMLNVCKILYSMYNIDILKKFRPSRCFIIAKPK